MQSTARNLLIAFAVGALLAVLVVRGCDVPNILPPAPTPAVVPIEAPGFRVLVIYESADGVPESANGFEIRQYLNRKCVKDASGHPDYRVWDQDVDLTNASQHMAKAMQRPRGELPWVLISTGSDGYEGLWPSDSVAALQLLKKYGGE